MSKKLRIAIVCDSIDTTLGWSVISALRFAGWLKAKGHKIIWITSKFQDQNKKKDFLGEGIYELSSLPPLWPQWIRFSYASVNHLAKIFQEEKIDIIYNIHPAIIARQAVRAAKRVGIPIVSHSHVWPELLVPWAPHFVQKRIKNMIAAIYRRCVGILSPTALTKRIFDDCNLQNKQLIVSNGVDTKIFHSKNLGSKESFNVLFVGRLDQEKNIFFLIEAFHLLKEQGKLDAKMHCTLVGGGSEEKKLKALITRYDLWTTVQFAGKMQSASAPLVKMYQDASVFVLPSLYELEWMVVLEAMACGCPLLIANSPTSAAKDFVHNNGYVFDIKDPQDLADKIYALSTNPELCALMGKISNEQAQQFSFPLGLERLEKFLCSFVTSQ